ncbi:MAG: transposase [Gemmatimonadaceae bacterium]|nr:transposase [Gloeobacterales cyanobacterium ES-bin-141]
MLVREAKLKPFSSAAQFGALDEAIRTAQCVRNRCLKHWMENRGTSKNDLQRLCAVLAQDAEQPWMKKLNAHARQASAEKAWQSVANFYRRCKSGEKEKGFPKFKKHSRSVEYKVSGYKLSDDAQQIKFTDGFEAGSFDLWMDSDARRLIASSKLNRVRVVRRADGYYAQFCLDIERIEAGEYTGSVAGIDLGLKYFIKDSKGSEVECPKYYRKMQKRLRMAQRRLCKKFRRTKKGEKKQRQSSNYHKQRVVVGRIHLKIQRQRKDFALKTARCVVKSNDLVAYEDLNVAGLVRNSHLSKSISDAGWSTFRNWLEYYGKLWSKVVVAVNPAYTTQDCSGCGYRARKSLSTRTHSCSRCGLEMCRDENAALNILKKGMEKAGMEYQNSSEGHSQTGSRVVGTTTPTERTTGKMNTSGLLEQSNNLSVVAEPVRECSDAS